MRPSPRGDSAEPGLPSSRRRSIPRGSPEGRLVHSLFRQVVASIGTYASLVGLVYSVKPAREGFSDIEKLGLLAGTVLMLLDVGLALREYSTRAERRFPAAADQRKRIRDFMFNWIGNAGRCVVFTRDLSWVEPHDVELVRRLHDKCLRRELTVVLPEHTSFTRELEGRGAEVVTYPALHYTIQSRFTLVDFGRAGARIAVGHGANGTHIIRIADSADPAFYLAEDLVELMRRL
jgi:hypothetical protein